MSDVNEIYFSVDAGIIERLGRELVSRPETAVSELIKNCYDADAIKVNIEFIDSLEIGGTLIINDDGLGMTYEQLIKGFMRLSSTEKIHTPKSEKYQRLRAGRKGIGRFATQRLGNNLKIITQTKEMTDSLELVIKWNDYNIDNDIQKIKNTLSHIPKQKEEGTILIIEGLKDKWDQTAILKVYRHISELIQPEYLSQTANDLHTANKSDEGFVIEIVNTVNGIKTVIKDELSLVFNNSLAEIEGFIDKVGDGFCGVKSESLELDDYTLFIPNKIPEMPDLDDEEDEKEKIKLTPEEIIEQEAAAKKFKFARDIHFKVYYFIYKRPDYYKALNKTQLNAIEKISKTASGVKLYRNGFKVSPYGDAGEDWLHLDAKYKFQSGVTNIPFFNRNFFGFVEIIDTNGDMFEETASREGLLENDAYHEMVYFIGQAMKVARGRIAEKVTLIREKEKTDDDDKDVPEQLDELEQQLSDLLAQGNVEASEELKKKINNLRDNITKIKEGAVFLLEEISMLRILAAMGLLIGEFSHEITQFTPSIRGYISAINDQVTNKEDPSTNLQSLNKLFSGLISYINYFKSSINRNSSRELKPINLIDVVNEFIKIVEPDFLQQHGEILSEISHFGTYTLPMHFSELNSILFNLYTNSKKAIHRADVIGKIKIEVGRSENLVFIKFNDNGDGIPEGNRHRIFNAFFTTSTPVGYDPFEDGISPGSGLGLKIVRDILESYKGEIALVDPDNSYTTAFRILIPGATSKELNDYGL